jgi:KRAB domain-containing zinc finger protein
MIGLTCEACSKVFIKHSRLERHQLTHSGVKPFNCNDCGVSLSTMYALLRHQRAHDKSDSVVCPLCSKELSSREHLSRHLKSRKHNPFNCDDCCAVFFRKEAFLHHQCTKPAAPKETRPRTRVKEELAVCPYIDCCKVYSKKSNLQAHVRVVHEGQRLACTKCSKDFAYRHTLERHKETCTHKDTNLNT